VVRGGIAEIDNMKASAWVHYVNRLAKRGFEEWALSVASLPEVGLDELCRAAAANIPRFNRYKRIRVTTAGEVRRVGYEVVADGLPHALIVLPNPPADTDYEAVESVLQPAQPNPGYTG
jgi:hypothetical protein